MPRLSWKSGYAIVQNTVKSVIQGTEENRHFGIRIGMKSMDDEVNWLQWDGCDRGYHLLCIDMDDPIDTEISGFLFCVYNMYSL